MEHPDYNSPLALKAFLDGNGMAMQKKFGQNFLVNGDARRRIVDALDIDGSKNVWEVGPGLGSMTAEILSRGASLTAFEIDRGFARLVGDFFADEAARGKFRLVEGDVLKTWKGELEKSGVPDRFFGNLPYNVAATIVADTIASGVRFEKAVVTVQKEVAVRMAADCGSGDYSSFSVLCRWAYRISNVADLAGGNFWPVPRVASRAVLMERRDGFPGCANPGLFMGMVRQLFSSRRKTVRNNLARLAGADSGDVISSAGIDPSSRAESLSVEELLALSDKLGEFLGRIDDGKN